MAWMSWSDVQVRLERQVCDLDFTHDPAHATHTPQVRDVRGAARAA